MQGVSGSTASPFFGKEKQQASAAAAAAAMGTVRSLNPGLIFSEMKGELLHTAKVAAGDLEEAAKAKPSELFGGGARQTS